MNILQKLLVKAILPSIRNTDIYRGQYQYVGNNTAQWVDQNNEAYITQGFEKNADLFAIVNYITKRASTIPWKLYKVLADGKLKELKDHALIDLIERPNPTMGQAFFMQTLLSYKLVLGNSYIYMPKLENGLNAGQSKELWIMPASKIEVVSNGWAKPVDHYRFVGTTSPKFMPEDVIHLKNVGLVSDMNNDIYGMSPLRPGVMPLTKSNSASASEVKSFQNMSPDGILSRKPNGTNDNKNWTEEQVDYLETWWRGRSGPENRRMAFTSAQLEFIRLGFSPVDLNVLESSKLSFRQLCNLYQFPAQLLNDSEHATYNNMREAKKAVYTDVIIPELYSLRDELNHRLVPAYGDNLWLDIDTSGIDVLQDDKKALAEWLNLCPFITNQDKQRIMGVTEDPEFPKYLVPNNLIEPENIGEDLVREAEKMINRI